VILVTNLILIIAMVTALVLILKTRWCSQYKRINTNPVLTVVSAYTLSYVAMIAIISKQSQIHETIKDGDYSEL
jgi:hypothetical protein